MTSACRSLPRMVGTGLGLHYGLVHDARGIAFADAGCFTEVRAVHEVDAFGFYISIASGRQAL